MVSWKLQVVNVCWCLPPVELQAPWEGNMKQNATVDEVYVLESVGAEYLLWVKVWLIAQRNSFLRAKRLRFQALFILI